jgi:hypothetical protein
MRVALAAPYRIGMFALLPVTFGVGTAVLWLRSSSWPLRIDPAGLILRNHRRIDWRSIKRIGVSRSLRDDRVSQIRIHHDGGVSKIPMRRLQDGEKVATAIVAMFEQTSRGRVPERSTQARPAPADLPGERNRGAVSAKALLPTGDGTRPSAGRDRRPPARNDFQAVGEDLVPWLKIEERL